MRGVCVECGGPVHIEIDTDGRGTAIDYIWPCQRCMPRQAARLPDTFRSGTMSKCQDCGGYHERTHPRYRLIRRCMPCRKKHERKYQREYRARHKHRWAVGGKYHRAKQEKKNGKMSRQEER